MLRLCKAMGTLIDPEKTEGLCTTLKLLDIEVDTIQMQLGLPPDRLARLEELLKDWQSKKCKKRDLLSLIGVLAWACKVVRPSRSFLCRLITLEKMAKEPHHFIRLNREARSDIEWWHLFASRWNGASMLFNAKRENCSITVTSDASGCWGCGAFCGKDWFQLRWREVTWELHITVKD